ncbi:MAG: hypothetical protein A3H70_02840 [Candidatus Komeilibacteria bacterium RIFCSPLOWO2_02_FULL_48_11]|uniref:Nudix hydrolase domain-containing protein n=1 Tax=Candidatus Komeilibacteria bacterium RIFCSPLOWO2_02_FULL_48_11 TaxID=1798553 RepID=A0A1G2BVV2_9BACT|nr:MAG: hypothetical protein A3H70_02840 [Candidatus Komeilibacteria bacterium RIFCSPLOWO2_02_FULL_48_11]
MQKVFPLSEIKKKRLTPSQRVCQVVVASGILVVDGKVLLIKRGNYNFPDPNSWVLPSGKVEPLETPEEAARREFKEETGISVRVIELLAIENYFYDAKHTRTHIIECLYLVKSVGNDFTIKLDVDHTDYRFASVREIASMASLVAPRKKVIRKVLASKA